MFGSKFNVGVHTLHLSASTLGVRGVLNDLVPVSRFQYRVAVVHHRRPKTVAVASKDPGAHREPKFRYRSLQKSGDPHIDTKIMGLLLQDAHKKYMDAGIVGLFLQGHPQQPQVTETAKPRS